MTVALSLTQRHRTFLGNHAINADRFALAGGYTAQKGAELPEHIKAPVPALCFPLPSIDGATTLWQARPDKPLKNERGRPAKYVQQWGRGGILFAPPQRADWRTAGTVLLTEGTKQTWSASEVAPDDCAVVGILGSYNWVEQGNPSGDLYRLVRESKAGRIVVAFDADVRSNLRVNDAAMRLMRTIDQLAADLRDGDSPAVLFSTVQNDEGSSKADIDGVLGARTEGERRKYIARLVESGGPLPSLSADDESPVMARFDLGVTLLREGTLPPKEGTRLTVPPEGTVMTCALRIRRITHWLPDPRHPDKATPEPRYDIEAALFRPNRAPLIAHLGGLAYKDMSNLEQLTASIPDPLGTAVVLPDSPKMRSALVSALRSTARNAEHIKMLGTIGWQREISDRSTLSTPAGFTLPEGTLGKDGWDPTTRADVSDALTPIQLSTPVGIEETRFSASMLTAGLRRLFNSPVAADASLAGVALAFLPIPPRSCVGYFAQFSRGKTLLMSTYSALLSAQWSPMRDSTMFTFNSTGNGVDLAMNGADDLPLFFDDMKMPSDLHERKALSEVFDIIVRRSHGGASKMRGMVTREGRLCLRDRDDSHPLAFVSGERVPTDAADSALSRIFQAPLDGSRHGIMERGDTLNDLVINDDMDGVGDMLVRFSQMANEKGWWHWTRPYERFDADGSNAMAGLRALTYGPAWRSTMAAYIGWIAARIDGEGDWAGELEEHRTLWEQRVAANPLWTAALQGGVRLSNREVIVVASLLLGLEQWTMFMDETGMWISDDLSDHWHRLMAGEVVDGMISGHLAAARAGTSGATGSLLDDIRQAVASGRLRVTGVSEHPNDNAPKIGDRRTVGGRWCVALLPQVIINEMKLPLNVSDLASQLMDAAIPDAHGQPIRRLRFDGVSARSICIDIDKWEDKEDA